MQGYYQGLSVCKISVTNVTKTEYKKVASALFQYGTELFYYP